MSKVLVVEDDETMRESIEVYLMVQKHSVTLASNTEEAIASCQQAPPDIAIIDYMLGESVNGIQLGEKLREIQPNLPVIIVTGLLSDGLEKQVEEYPRMKLFLKPFNASDLGAAIDSFSESA